MLFHFVIFIVADTTHNIINTLLNLTNFEAIELVFDIVDNLENVTRDLKEMNGCSVIVTEVGEELKTGTFILITFTIKNKRINFSNCHINVSIVL